MTPKELNNIISMIADCDAYLKDRMQCSAELFALTEAVAQRAVMERRSNLYDRLREAGLRIEEEA